MMFDKVEKFELGKEEYSKRTDTVQVFLSRYPPHGSKYHFTVPSIHTILQAYLKKNKLGKYNEEEMAALTKEKEEREAAEAKMVGATSEVCNSKQYSSFCLDNRTLKKDL